MQHQHLLSANCGCIQINLCLVGRVLLVEKSVENADCTSNATVLLMCKHGEVQWHPYVAIRVFILLVPVALATHHHEVAVRVLCNTAEVGCDHLCDGRACECIHFIIKLFCTEGVIKPRIRGLCRTNSGCWVHNIGWSFARESGD